MPSISKRELVDRFVEGWKKSPNNPNGCVSVNRLIVEFLAEINPKVGGDFRLQHIRPHLIVAKTGIWSLKSLPDGSLRFHIGKDSSHVTTPSNSVFQNACKVFAKFLENLTNEHFSYNDLKEIYNSTKAEIQKGLKTEYALAGVLDVVARLVRCGFLIIENPEERASEDAMSTSAREKNQLEDASKNPTLGFSSRRRIVTDQHYGKNSLAKSVHANTEGGIDEKTLSDLLKSKRSELINKPGILVKSDKDSESEPGTIEFGSQLENEKSTACIQISFDNPMEDDDAVTFKFLGSSREFFVEAKAFGKYKNTWTMDINYSSASVGTHKSVLVFTCKYSNGECCDIYRFLHGQTKSLDMDILIPSAPYQRPKPVVIVRDPTIQIIRGVPPEWFSSLVVAVPLKEYPIPSQIRSNINHGKGNVTDNLKDLLEADLAEENHEEKFHSLLYLEELQMEVDMRRYDMSNQVMNSRAGTLMALKVPGLAENRPSLIIGDKVYVTRVGEEDKKIEYEGYIHQIEEETILVKFNNRFHREHINGNRYNIKFSFNRFTLRMQHRALEIAHKLLSADVFPNAKPYNSYPPLLSENQLERQLRVRDRKIESNPEQLKAVANIVQGVSRPNPYVIFGPPGTGKTVTLVEAIRQVLLLIPGSRILACAPSNSAADLILHRLLNPCPIAKREFFRINAISRSLLTLPPEMDIKECCEIENGRFAIPDVERIKEYRVVVSTMTTAGRLVSMGIPMGHFTHVFMDECGQAVEPETLIPLAGLFTPDSKNGGQIVLAGDPKQLGPVLRSPFACKHGLQMSLLERLMKSFGKYQRTCVMSESDSDSNGDEEDSSEDEEDSSEEEEDFEEFMDRVNDDSDSEVEDKGVYDEKYITKLVKNYRSHPDILKLPNDLFYDGELVASADEFARNSLCQWKKLPNNSCPMIFHGVQGEDLREANSPSFYNPQEVKIVCDYVKVLLEERGLGVSPSQIGIISPYRKQVEKIRKLLSSSKHVSKINEIKVGSVEEFQGQERRVIIISTVRSNKEYLQLDSKFRLGFLSNPKRFNVAVTRAKALLILVGNPHVLSKDECWNKLLQYCQEKNCYIGCEFTNQDYLGDIIDSMKRMGLDLGETDVNEDTPWERKDV